MASIHDWWYILKFSTKEREEIGMAWLALTVAFTLALREKFAASHVFFYSLITLGVVFLIQSVVQKIVANREQSFAEFRSNQSLLVASVVLSFFGVVFAAPGGVVTYGATSVSRNGRIAIGGPLVNIVLALLLRALIFVPGAREFALVTSALNAWLALYSLLPLPGLPGEKVYSWNKYYFFAAFVGAGALVYAFGM